MCCACVCETLSHYNTSGKIIMYFSPLQIQINLVYDKTAFKKGTPHCTANYAQNIKCRLQSVAMLRLIIHYNFLPSSLSAGGVSFRCGCTETVKWFDTYWKCAAYCVAVVETAFFILPIKIHSMGNVMHTSLLVYLHFMFIFVLCNCRAGRWIFNDFRII